MKRKRLLSILIFSVVLTISFVFASHIITTFSGGSSFSVNEDVSTLYNISVNNTDVNYSANISQVNITLPGNSTFVTDTNGTDSGTHSFTNTSTILSWDNDGLVLNETVNYFWFNATATVPGDYNLTVTTTNSSGSYSSNLTITVNDTTDPYSIDFVSPSESNASTISRSYIRVNVTAEDNVGIDKIIVRLYNSSNIQINSSESSTSPLFINFTNLSDGTYYFNATVNDSAGNENTTATRTVTINTVVGGSSNNENEDSSSSSGSSYPILIVDDNEFKEGFNQKVFEYWEIKFTVDDDVHSITINDVADKSMRMTIASTPQEVLLSVGEEKKVDVSDNGYYDLSVKLHSITELPTSNFANITINSINEKIIDKEEPAEESSSEEVISSETPSDNEKETSNKKYLLLVILFIIILSAYLVYINYSRIKKRLRKVYK